MTKILAVLILVGIFKLPPDYYFVLRMVVSIVCGFLLYQDWKEYNYLNRVGLSLLIVIFNPVDPIYLTKSLWVIIDLISGIYLLMFDTLNEKPLSKIFATIGQKNSFLSKKISSKPYDFIESVSNDAIVDLTSKLYDRALSEANGIIVQNDDVAKKHQMTIVILLCQGLMQLIDRKAFVKIRSKRDKFIDELMISTAVKVVISYSDENLSEEQKRTLLTTMIEKNNEVMLFLGQFKKITHGGNEPASGTLLWEFGSLFAEKIGHPKDILFVTIGIESLMNIFDSLNLNETFTKFN